MPGDYSPGCHRFHGIELGRFREDYARVIAPVLDPKPGLKPLAPEEAPKIHTA
ncbi:hypothetical protein PLCT2_02201 [Planctomycetaceae bacterium]|nr:hypothetical protein PLCT2_02201 [Planctomycetaceae bacterium]